MCDGAYGVDAALMALELLEPASMVLRGGWWREGLVVGGRERELRSAWVTGTRDVGRQDSLAWALAWERSVC